MSEKDEAGLYNALVAYQLHQDQLIWSRVQLLIALQAGTLVAGFSQRYTWLSPMIMLFGGIFTLLIALLALKDRDDRVVNQILMDKLANRLVPDEIKEEIIAEIGELKCIEKKLSNDQRVRLIELKKYETKQNNDNLFVFFSYPKKYTSKLRRWATGKSILSFSMVFFFITDLTLVAIYTLINMGIIVRFP